MSEPPVVMVVAPHPDDAEMSCGGTVAQWVREGREVIYVICTNGDKGSDDPEMTSEKLALIRQREQQEAANILGVKEIVFLGHPDGGLEDSPAFRGELVRLIRKYQPRLVMTTDPYRRYLQHRDHRITGLVTLDAIYPFARDRLSYPEHLAQGLSPHRVKEIYLWGSEEPDTLVDIGATLEQKIAALRCHVSQIRPEWREHLEDWIRQRAAEAGQSQGLASAEAFRRVEIRY